MGTTAATLHLLLPPGAMPDDTAPLLKAYGKIGWGKPKRGEAATRRVLISATDDFVTIHDSACAALDDGTLKELGALLSKSLGSAALVTTVNDSDSFGVVLYDKGKQVDAAGEEAEGMTTLAGKRRANAWAKALQPAAVRRMLAGEPMAFRPAEDLAAALAAAEAAASVFAEDRLAAWCRVAGLPAEAAVATADDAAPRVVATLDLVPRAVLAKPGAAAPEGRELRFYLSTDDCPYHEFHPAPWPCTPREARGFTWPVTCRGGGISGVTLRIAMDRADGAAFRLRGASLRAMSFHNGQVMSATPLAEWVHEASAEEAMAEALTLEAPSFALRDPAPGSRSQVLLLLRLEIEAPDGGGEVEIRPALHAGGDAAPLDLPPLRLRATSLDWVPAIARPGPAQPSEAEALLRLNAPSLHTAVAILPDAGAAPRAAIRGLFEGVLAACTGAGLTVTIATEKQMTPSFSVPKAQHALPLAEAVAAKPWAALFDPASNFQTIRIGIGPAGAVAPLAGLVLQASIRAGMPVAVEDGVLHVALWSKARPEAEAVLGIAWTTMEAVFRAWIADAAPMQGWLADCAWIPRFDRAEDYEHTPYEIVGTTAHARMGLHDAVAGPAWTRERLKFLGRRIWLGPLLAARIDRAALAAVADVTGIGDVLDIAPRPGATAAALEGALRPILPASG